MRAASPEEEAASLKALGSQGEPPGSVLALGGATQREPGET